MISEKLLQYVWANQWFAKEKLFTVHRQSLSIIHQGFPHQDAGPDFKQAIVQIDGVTWAGNVEIHIRSSDWYKHKHQNDMKYNSVILHVVFEYDKDVFIEPNNPLPTLQLKPLLSEQLLLRYGQLVNTLHILPCEAYVAKIRPLVLQSFLTRLAFDRLVRKQAHIFEVLHSFSEDWEQVLFYILCQSFGFKTNAPAFEMLGKSLPYKLLKRHSGSHLQVAALIFGQAGLLGEDYEDNYYQTLQQEYLYLRAKYKFVPVDTQRWNFLRLRPHNFPCIRLAQLVEIVFRHPQLFETIVYRNDLFCFQNIFVNCVDTYWSTHYHFGKTSDRSEKKMGKRSFNLLIINALVPFLYAYGTFTGSNKLQEFSMQLLESLPFEKNHITKKYQCMGICDENAGDSQAMLELHHEYCENRNCIECAIGQQILLME